MPEPLDPAEIKLVHDVQEYGWHVVRVAGEGDLPEFSYSVGLFRTFGHPEILIYGLPGADAHQIINAVGDQLRDGVRFTAGQTVEGFLEGYLCTFRVIPPSQYPEHLGFASWFYDYDTFPALQLVYPDRDGRWPWQDGASPRFRSQQLVLADAPVRNDHSDGAA